MKLTKKLLKIATVLALIVIVLGAYTRLKDAGLGCPDWPGCYGKIIAPMSPEKITSAQTSFTNQPFAAEKAWTEMVHRYVAGSLGILVFIIFLTSIFNVRELGGKFLVIVSFLSILVVFQAFLGMWTVTMRLYPVVVMGHLLGGLSILAILWWLQLKLSKLEPIASKNIPTIRKIKPIAKISLFFLILQLALGGWTSANYAAVVCSDFPTCQGSLWPEMDFINAFNLFNAGILDSPGTVLENTARVTIQMSHRFGALLVAIFLGFTSYKLICSKSIALARLGTIGVSLLSIQLILGISNVLAGLPLFIAVMHNAIGAILLLLVVTINYKLYNYAKQKPF